jgi:hypothetical protein
MEVWKKIEGYDNYEFSTKGRIYEIKKAKFINPRMNNNGFLEWVYLKKNGCWKLVKYDYFIATAFIENLNKRDRLIHLDKNVLNNDISNLFWVEDYDHFCWNDKYMYPLKVEEIKSKLLS